MSDETGIPMSDEAKEQLAIPAESFVGRQTHNLVRLVEASKFAARVPSEVQTLRQKQEIAVQVQANRCLRCGDETGAFFSQPSLCEKCFNELLARDQADRPGCVWWGELLPRASP